MTRFPYDCGTGNLDLNYKCRCDYQPFLGSVLGCIDHGSWNVEDVTKGYDYVIEVCREQAGVEYKFSEMVNFFTNATDKFESFNETGFIYHPVPVNEDLYMEALQSVKHLIHHRTLSTHYGSILVGYWVLLIIVGMVGNIGQWAFPDLLMTMHQKYFRWGRRHVSSVQVLSTRNSVWQNYIGPTLPTRLQAITIGIYMFLIFVLSVVSYDFNEPSVIFRNRKLQFFVYVADRTGILAITQYPLVYLFAGRNNVLQVLTGWTFRTFNIYHRWMSRCVFVMISVHALMYVQFTCGNGDYPKRWTLTKWKCANIAMVCSALLILVSFRFLRNPRYEFFKATHQLLAVGFLIGTCYHIITLGWIEYVWITLFLWAFDHSVRLGKIIVSGGVVWANCEAILQDVPPASPSKESPLPEPEVHSIRLTISHSGWWRDYPGCYVFIYFLKWNMFWQSHPITVMEPASEQTRNQLICVIRVKNGLTKVLGEFIARQPLLRVRIPVLVEGPYGSCLAFRAYEHAIFYAGGVGMTAIYGLALDLGRKFRADMLRGEHKTHSIQINWIIPQLQYLDICSEEIHALAAIGSIMEINVYVTNNSKCRVSSAQLIDKKLSNVQIRLETKPEIEALMVQKVFEISTGSIAVISCGPGRLNRDVRKGTLTSLKKERGARVDYFEEELAW